MKKILTGKQMLLCDKCTIEDMGVPSRELMERAALSLCDLILNSGYDLSHTVFLCGTGNNGGDGMAMAYNMKHRGCDVSVVLVGDESKCTAESAYRLSILRANGINVSDELNFDGATLIVDALFGTGPLRAPEGKYLEAIRAVNIAAATVFSVDIPSGVSADTGDVATDAIRADMTGVVSNLKRGHVFYPGAEFCGEIQVCHIGISDNIVRDEDALLFIDDDDLLPIRNRAAYSNKGTFGRVLVIGGSYGMAGAAYLSALAAYRSGAGLCEIFTTEANRQILQTLLPEAVITVYSEVDLSFRLETSLARADSVVIGPGLGTDLTAERLVKETFEQCKVPMVCDADALNIVAKGNLRYPNCPVVVTPHLGEMSRLTGEGVIDIRGSLTTAAKEYSARTGTVCLLKDARSVISDGHFTYVNMSGCSAMAKGGSGDVLTGVVAAIMAGGFSASDSALYGAFLHGRAGEAAAEKLGMHAVLARDIADCINR